MPNSGSTNSTEELIQSVQNKEADFIRLIQQRLGLIIHPMNRDLQHLLINACTQFKCNPEQYLQYLKSCSDNAQQLEFLISGITIGETYFFRDKAQMDLLRNYILPELINLKRKQNHLSLRIWSAGCASGEEIYTLAIMLCELLPDIKKWQLKLLGTDINTEVLKKARSGLYYKWSMRSIENDMLSKYFSVHGNQYLLSDTIRDKVNFLYLNLNDNPFPSILNGTNAQDLILCRNVLIYFNPESIQKVMAKLSLSLVDRGVLLLGASDPVWIEGLNLNYEHQANLFFLRQNLQSVSVKNTLNRSYELKEPLSLKPLEKEVIYKEPASDKSAEVDEAKQVSLLLEKANKAANQGKLDEAVQYCRDSLGLDATNKEAYFILALTLIELNCLDEAESALRKTIFLEYKFVEGHFQLGLLLLKRKNHKEGLKSLQNALTLVNKQDPLALVSGSQGLNYQGFSDILNKEIALYRRTEGLT